MELTPIQQIDTVLKLLQKEKGHIEFDDAYKRLWVGKKKYLSTAMY